MTHRVLITAAASFAIALGAFGLLARGGGADRHADARAVLPSLPPPSATTDQRIAALQQTVRFCTSSDGVRIAYATSGAGPPLVKPANWLTHVEYDWESPVWRHWLLAMAEEHTAIRYDERGCGLSDWEVDRFGFDA